MIRERCFRGALLAYPRVWRDRYGDELSDLADELAAAEQISWWRLILGTLASGFVVRIRGWQWREWMAITTTGVSFVAIVLVSLSLTASRSPVQSPRTQTIYSYGPGTPSNPPTGVLDSKIGTECLVKVNPTTHAVVSAKSVPIPRTMRLPKGTESESAPGCAGTKLEHVTVVKVKG